MRNLWVQWFAGVVTCVGLGVYFGIQHNDWLVFGTFVFVYAGMYFMLRHLIRQKEVRGDDPE